MCSCKMGLFVVVLVVCAFGAANCEEAVKKSADEEVVASARELIEQGKIEGRFLLL